jgi:hypothetical protein
MKIIITFPHFISFMSVGNVFPDIVNFFLFFYRLIVGQAPVKLHQRKNDVFETYAVRDVNRAE